jgi:hypothetical protein
MPRRRVVGFRASVVPTDTTAKRVIEIRVESGDSGTPLRLPTTSVRIMESKPN